MARMEWWKGIEKNRTLEWGEMDSRKIWKKFIKLLTPSRMSFPIFPLNFLPQSELNSLKLKHINYTSRKLPLFFSIPAHRLGRRGKYPDWFEKFMLVFTHTVVLKSEDYHLLSHLVGSKIYFATASLSTDFALIRAENVIDIVFVVVAVHSRSVFGPMCVCLEYVAIACYELSIKKEEAKNSNTQLLK